MCQNTGYSFVIIQFLTKLINIEAVPYCKICITITLFKCTLITTRTNTHISKKSTHHHICINPFVIFYGSIPANNRHSRIFISMIFVSKQNICKLRTNLLLLYFQIFSINQWRRASMADYIHRN